jgi:hypothetical protein
MLTPKKNLTERTERDIHSNRCTNNDTETQEIWKFKAIWLQNPHNSLKIN